mmetsp:Transcript_9995/g.18185  ORF Transcript_9995/g.18185 Transcript_9995/m.18185 type:complete len:202 (+) Transcript_9995:481-1086(+)
MMSALLSSFLKLSTISALAPRSSRDLSTARATRQFPCSICETPPSSVMVSGGMPERRRMSTISARSCQGPALNRSSCSIFLGLPYFPARSLVNGFMKGVNVPLSSTPSCPGINSLPLTPTFLCTIFGAKERPPMRAVGRLTERREAAESPEPKPVSRTLPESKVTAARAERRHTDPHKYEAPRGRRFRDMCMSMFWVFVLF